MWSAEYTIVTDGFGFFFVQVIGNVTARDFPKKLGNLVRDAKESK